jgi:cytochrome P450
VRAELSAVSGGRALCAEDLPQLVYLTRVLHESMRLYPPAWLLARTPTADDVVGGCLVPKGAVVLCSPYATHRRPDLWEAPDRFDPDRFATCPRSRYAYLPFGGGGRQCIGDNFGMQAMQLILAQVIRAFRLTLAPARPLELHAGVTLRPKRDLRLRLWQPSCEPETP